MDRGDRNLDAGDRREPVRFTFLPHALEGMEEPRRSTAATLVERVRSGQRDVFV